MSIRIKRCPCCSQSVNNQEKICLDEDNKAIKYIKVLTTKDDITIYRCTNFRGHGWREESKNSKEWYHLTFTNKPTINKSDICIRV